MEDITKNLETLIDMKNQAIKNKEQVEQGAIPTAQNYIDVCNVAIQLAEYAIKHEKFMLNGIL